MTRRVLRYLRWCAVELVDDHEGGRVDRIVERRNALWARMTQQERDLTNRLVGAIFGKWY